MKPKSLPKVAPTHLTPALAKIPCPQLSQLPKSPRPRGVTYRGLTPGNATKIIAGHVYDPKPFVDPQHPAVRARQGTTDAERRSALRSPFNDEMVPPPAPDVRAMVVGVDFGGFSMSHRSEFGDFVMEGGGSTRSASKGFVITGSEDRRLRLWDLGKSERTTILSGLDSDHDKPSYSILNANANGLDAVSSYVETWPASPSGGSRPSQRISLISQHQQNLLKAHQDVITALACIDSPFRGGIALFGFELLQELPLQPCFLSYHHLPVSAVLGHLLRMSTPEPEPQAAYPTTPLPPRRLDELKNEHGSIHSTPYGKGTSSQARLKTDGTKDPNYKFVEEDLKTTQGVEFVNMLKAMIMMKRVREDKEDGAPLSPEDLDAYGKEQVNVLIEEAVKFCNDEKRSQKVKDKLAEVLKSQRETPRYQPLIVALNHILLDFKGKDIGSLEGCATEDETLYTINDPSVIESKRLSEICGTGTKCKPDICEVPLEKLLNATQPKDLEDENLRAVAKSMEVQPEYWEEARKNAKPGLQWSDVVHCLEVKCTASKALTTTPGRFSQPYTAAAMFASVPHLLRAPASPSAQSSSNEPPAPRSGSHKRSGDSAPDEQPAKRIRSGIRSSGPPPTSNNDAGKNPYLKDDVQCAFYGIELLRAAWDKTHSIVTLLSDSSLRLNWYDSQGSIRTDSIDIVEQLPLLVAMTVLFQRFKKPMRGIAGIKLEMTLDNKQVKFLIPADVDARWELKGRRPVTCIPVPVESKTSTTAQTQRPTRGSKTSSDSDQHREDVAKLLSEHHFKWSWRENTRDNEADIIATAKERAEKYLGEHKSDVLNHLPEVKHAQDYASLSTSHIRKYAGLDVKGSRLPSLMVSRRLSEVTDLDGEVLKTKIWEIIRCIVLLWRLGIAHSDVSLGNIMVNQTKDGTQYLILNDFDLAIVMNPGDVSPQKKGLERTGTKPFMAVELLEYPVGTVKRVCRHDLESVIWVLVWLCRQDPDWYNFPFKLVCQSKLSYSVWAKPRTLPEGIEKKYEVLWRPVTNVVIAWMQVFVRADLQEMLDSLTEDQVLDAIRQDDGFPCPKEYADWDWLRFYVQ
ncbi:hypothetical protein NMY22_g4187 [Coprinellus aureogranulatus]|nr:hypothetical protein NMY22_g4187 [Coprinellus aureogranulatus]